MLRVKADPRAVPIDAALLRGQRKSAPSAETSVPSARNLAMLLSCMAHLLRASQAFVSVCGNLGGTRDRGQASAPFPVSATSASGEARLRGDQRFP